MAQSDSFDSYSVTARLSARAAVSTGATLALLALAALGVGFHETAISSDAHNEWCEVRPDCRLYVDSSSQCTGVMGWTGSCKNGFVHGEGALHSKHGTATYGKFFKGRARGQIVWHENGIPTRMGVYQSWTVTLDERGQAKGPITQCYWDEETERVMSEVAGETRCEAVASQLGQAAFSPEIWRTIAIAIRANRDSRIDPGKYAAAKGSGRTSVPRHTE